MRIRGSRLRCASPFRRQWGITSKMQEQNMKRLLLAGAATLALLGSSAAMARVDVGISIGIPGLVYGVPEYYPPVRYVEPPRVVVVPERVYTPVYGYAPRYYRDGYYERRGWRGERGRGHWKHHDDDDD